MIDTLEYCNIVFDSLENGTLVVDEEGVVWAWNKWLEINTGIVSEDIIGKNLEAFYPEIDYKGFKRKIRTTLRLNTPTFYDASLSNRFISIPRNKITTSLLKTMQLQVTISTYIPQMKRVMVSIQDISDLHELKMTLQQRMAEIAYLNNELKQDRHIIDANLMIVKTDCNCLILDVTEAFHTFTGYTKEDLTGYVLSSFHATNKSDTDFVHMKEILQHKKKWSGEAEIKQKNGGVVWMDTVISPYLDDKGEAISYTAIYHDITDKKRIERLSITDPLTKLYNRQKFNELFELLLLRRHWENGCSFGLIVADIDFFKKVNDTYGHQAGDRVLVSVAEMFAQTIRPGDVLARWGGEEFVFLIADVDVEKIRYVAQKLRSAIEKIDIPEIGHVTASFGMSIYSEGDTQESLLHRADTALYQAKDNGRNRVELLLV